MAFMRSGGYALSARVRRVTQRVLLLWGRHDEIVDPMFAKRYLEDLRNCRHALPDVVRAAWLLKKCGRANCQWCSHTQCALPRSIWDLTGACINHT